MDECISCNNKGTNQCCECEHLFCGAHIEDSGRCIDCQIAKDKDELDD